MSSEHELPPSTSKDVRNRRFTLRVLLSSIALIAVLMVPVSYYVRARLNRPNLIVGVTLLLPDSVDDAATYVAKLETDAFRQRVLNSSRLQGVASLKTAANPKVWLASHLSVRTMGNSDLIEVLAHGRTNRIEASDLRAVVDATLELIQADARKSNASVYVVNKTNVEP